MRPSIKEVDDPQGGRRATGARGVAEPRPSQVESLSLQEAVHPVVNRLTTDLEQFGDVFDGLPLGELGEQGVSPNAAPWAEGVWSTRSSNSPRRRVLRMIECIGPPLCFQVTRSPARLSKNFLQPT